MVEAVDSLAAGAAEAGFLDVDTIGPCVIIEA